MYRQVPNALSFSRIVVAAPLVMFTAAAGESPACHVTALVLWGYVIVSDWLDGRLARRWKVVSPWGKHLDPLADKVVELAVYGTLAALYGSWLLGGLTGWITVRHGIIMVLRRFATQAHTSIPARWSGKIRTAVSFALALALIARLPYRTGQPHWVIQYSHDIPFWILEATVWTLFGLTLLSLVDYLRANRRLINRFP